MMIMPMLIEIDNNSKLKEIEIEKWLMKIKIINMFHLEEV